MKILYYLSGISPNVGGAEKFIMYFKETQKECDVCILTRFYNEESLVVKMIEATGIKIYSLNINHLSIKNYTEYTTKLKNFFKSNGKKFDVLHNNSIEDPSVSIYAHKYGIKKILSHVHSYNTEDSRIKKLAKKCFEYGNNRYANNYLACSIDVGKARYSSNIWNKIDVIINGIMLKKFDYNEKKSKCMKQELNIQNKFVVCNIGRMEKVKNLEFLIDIFYEIQKHKEAVLLLVGDGSEKNRLEKKCYELNIDDKVYFFGEKEDTYNYLFASDVFVMPSFSEGLGIAAIEAQATGMMTVVSDKLVPKSVDCTGLVTFVEISKDANFWAKKIIEIGNNYSRTSKIQLLNGSDYDSNVMAQKLIELYN